MLKIGSRGPEKCEVIESFIILDLDEPFTVEKKRKLVNASQSCIAKKRKNFLNFQTYKTSFTQQNVIKGWQNGSLPSWVSRNERRRRYQSYEALFRSWFTWIYKVIVSFFIFQWSNSGQNITRFLFQFLTEYVLSSWSSLRVRACLCACASCRT